MIPVGRTETPIRVASFNWITCLSLSMTVVRRERKPHETNILGYEPGRSTAGVTATLRHVLSKASEWCVGAFVASADVEGAFDGIKHDEVEKALLQKKCSSRIRLLSFARICTLPGAPMSPALLVRSWCSTG